MARGRKVRVSDTDIEKARKKIKSMPKRGRWPRFEGINKHDKGFYIDLFLNPEKRIVHPKYGTVCFTKEVENFVGLAKDADFDIVLPPKYNILGAIYFHCDSYDSEGVDIIDTTCLLRCERTSCPYYKKGFVKTTLENKTFEADVTAEVNRKHDLGEKQ